MHPDARRPRGSFANLDFVLARQLRERPAAAQRVPGSGGPEQHPLSTGQPQPLLEAFEVLYEAEDLTSYPLPFELERIYAGLGFPQHVVYSNFVSSLDGVVSLGTGTSAGSTISGKAPADRFLMALLRACADAVLVGAGTLRATPGHLWTPAHVFAQQAESFAALRRSLGRSAEPRLVLVTHGGDIDPNHVAVQHGALIFTTNAGAGRCKDRLPASCEVAVTGTGEHLDMGTVIEELRHRGLGVVLTEGGPHVMGELIDRALLDEAFLTVSPVVAGRGEERRLGMVEGVELLPSRGAWSRLLSARRHGDYLFLRYRLGA